MWRLHGVHPKREESIHLDDAQRVDRLLDTSQIETAAEWRHFCNGAMAEQVWKHKRAVERERPDNCCTQRYQLVAQTELRRVHEIAIGPRWEVERSGPIIQVVSQTATAWPGADFSRWDVAFWEGVTT